LDWGQLSQALADRGVTAAPQQVHHDGAQEGEHWSPDSVGVAMGDLTQLGRADSKSVPGALAGAVSMG